MSFPPYNKSSGTKTITATATTEVQYTYIEKTNKANYTI